MAAGSPPLALLSRAIVTSGWGLSAGVGRLGCGGEWDMLAITIVQLGGPRCGGVGAG